MKKPMHADAKADAKQIKSMVKPDALKAKGGMVKKAKGGKC